MSRSSLSRQMVVASILATVVVAGCDSSQSTGTTTTSAARPVAAPDAVPTDIRAALFDRLPADFVEEPVGSDSDGPLDLARTAEAVDDQETAMQETLLRQDGFVGAYQRTWVVKARAELLIIRVQVMGSPAQALDYFDLLTAAGNASGQTTAWPMPQLADASGFTRYFTGSTGPQVAEDVNLVRGRLFYHLILTAPTGTISPGDVMGIARSQSSRAAALGYP